MTTTPRGTAALHRPRWWCGAIALLETGVVEALWALMTIEHVAMFGAMLLVMAARPDEYAQARHGGELSP